MPTGRPAVRKHLMTPGQPRPRRQEPMSLSTVQRWVMSTLAATTILHLAIGLMITAAYSERQDGKIGLLAIATAFGVMAVGAALVIHKHRVLSPWLALGLLPTAVGALFVF